MRHIALRQLNRLAHWKFIDHRLLNSLHSFFDLLNSKESLTNELAEQELRILQLKGSLKKNKGDEEEATNNNSKPNKSGNKNA